jgi:hypothetical protein
MSLPTDLLTRLTTSHREHGPVKLTPAAKARPDMIFGKDRCIDAVGKNIKLSEAFAQTAQL